MPALRPMSRNRRDDVGRMRDLWRLSWMSRPLVRTFVICVASAVALAACEGPGAPEPVEVVVDCSQLEADDADLVTSQELAFDGTVVGTSLERNVSAAFQRGLVDDGRTQPDEELTPAELESIDNDISRLDSGEEVTVGEVWPWTTFEVHAWYTSDAGPEISIWTAGLDLEAGQRWLIAGSAFGTPEGLGDHSQQSGMATACASRRFSVEAASQWDLWFGGTVAPGSDRPENEPDPSVVAEVESRRRMWEQSGLSGYTFSGYAFAGDVEADEGCSTNGRLRVVVEGGEIVQAINVTETCELPVAAAGLWTIDDAFDLAALVSGTGEWNIEWADEWPYPRNVYGYDRSFEAEMSVLQFHPEPIPGYLGADLKDAVGDNRALWDSLGVGDYTISIAVDCFCPPEIVSPVTVMVSEGEIVRAIRDGVDVEPSSLELVPLTIDELFELADRTSGNVVVGFDPEYGFPVDIYDEGDRNTIDDEVGYRLTEFEAAPIDRSEPALQPASDPSAVASDIPEEWQAEIQALRASAGSGRLVGFVHLTGDTSSGVPLADSQPFCTGFGTFADIVPGAVVEVYGERGDPAGQGVLRGSAFDAHVGCVLWFGVDITESDSYLLRIGRHETDPFDASWLDEGVALWSSPESLEANCELIPDPFTNCLGLSNP